MALAIIGVCLSFVFSSAFGAPGTEETEPNGVTIPHLDDLYRKGRWDWSVEALYTFIVVANPWHCLIDLEARHPNPHKYHFLTETVGLRYRLTGIAGPWLLHGSAQLCADLVGTEIVRGPETYFVGGAVGMHFDFVQPGWRIVPYTDFRFGPGAIDATVENNGQQNDLEFTYLWGAGVRYHVSPSLSVSFGAIDQHLSTAWLTRNVSVDTVGINIRLEKKF